MSEWPADIRALLDDPPYDTKSVLTLRVVGTDTTYLRVLSWAPFEHDGVIGESVGENDEPVVWIGAWAIGEGIDETPAAEIVEKWRPLERRDVVAMVEARCGPLGTDPGPVALRPRLVAEPDCLACAGRRFDLLSTMQLMQPRFCTEHREEAAVLIEVAERCIVQNQRAWDEWADADDAFGAWHVAYPVRVAMQRHFEEEGPFSATEPTQQCDLLLAFLEPLATPDDLELALEALDIGNYDFEDWASQVAFRLGLQGWFDLVRQVLAAVDRVLPEETSGVHGEFAVQLAEAGHYDDANAEIAGAVATSGRGPYVLMFAGEVREHQDDVVGAREWYERAVAETQVSRDLYTEAEAWCHLSALAEGAGDDAAKSAADAEVERLVAEMKTRQRTRHGTARRDDIVQWGYRVGRNEACPCGSGRKFKHCHARH